MKKSTKTIVILIVIIFVLAILTMVFMPSLKALASGHQLHSAEEVQQSYDKGYSDGAKNEDYLKDLVSTQRHNINDLISQNNALQGKVDELNAFIKEHSARVIFHSNISELDDNSNFIKLEWVLKGNVIDADKIPENPTRNGFSFVGWSVDGDSIIDLGTYIFSTNTIVFAVWEEGQIETSLKLNGGSARVNYQEYTADEIFTIGYEENIKLTDAASSGVELYCYFIELFDADNQKIGGKRLNSIDASIKEIFSETFNGDEFGQIVKEVARVEIELFWKPVVEDIDSATAEELKVLNAIELNSYITANGGTNMMTNTNDETFVKALYTNFVGITNQTDTVEELEIKLIAKISNNRLGYEIELEDTEITNFYRILYKILTNSYE